MTNLRILTFPTEKNSISTMFIISVLIISHITGSIGQDYIINQNALGNNMTWCTTSNEEQNKCVALSRAVERDMSSFGSDFRKVVCRQGASKDDCMSLLDQELGDVTTLDAGEVFVGGRYHSLVPIMQEAYNNRETFYYSVAAVKRGSLPDVRTLHDLRGKKACFPAVGTLAGWIIPVYTLMKYGGMEIVDCNNHVKSTINYFGPSCAVNSLIDKYNPIGDNSYKLCELCVGRAAGEKCTTNDPYYGFEGAFRCLVESGDIAFLKHTTIQEMTNKRLEWRTVRKEEFEIICKDGQRRPVDDYLYCNWGKVPAHAVVTTSAKSGEHRRLIQRFLRRVVELYGQPFSNSSTSNPGLFPEQRFKRQSYEYGNNPETRYSNQVVPNQIDNYQTYEQFNLFESSPRYGYKHNLLLQDSTADLVSLSEVQQTYSGLLGDSLKMILGVRDCPVNRMTLCVTSEPELEKCVKMKVAMKAQLLKPELLCYKGHSQINCMQAIRNGAADVAVLDAGDIYTAGLNYDLVPIISEVYNLETPEYYVVAVAKEQDPTTELTYLKGKYTCHTGINTGAGWVVPLAFLISNGWIRSYGCNSIRAAAEYFTKSCVPGALSTEYNTGVPYDNMCDLCHGASFRYCRRDASEDYYGYTGAFRCLVEGGGQVAFVKHTTVMENTDGKRAEWWARNMLTGDFELLCPDGTRAQMEDYKRCSLGKVKANAVVARGGYGYNETQINAFINLFLYAQQFYGSKDLDDFSFSMFYSYPPYSDLIFQDATQQLHVVPASQRHYGTYLGKDFLRAKRIVDCYAGADHTSYSWFTVAAALVISYLAL